MTSGATFHAVIPYVKIQISPHALLRAVERGTHPLEIEEVLATGTLQPARQGRQCTKKLFRIEEERQGRLFTQKLVEVYHVTEGDAIVVVTVYVFFGTGESRNEDRI